MRVAVIGGDRAFCEDIKCELEKRTYEVDIKINGAINDLLSPADNYDVIILDVDSRGEHGIRLCRELRANGICTPVITLMYRNDENNMIEGFEAGADACMYKPVFFSELNARIGALARRRSSSYRRAIIDDTG